MVLQRISSLLKETFFDCSYVAASEIEPFDYLIAIAETNSKEKRKMIKIMAFEQQLDPSMLKKIDKDRCFRIQFLHQLPFEVTPLAVNQIASLLLFLNQNLDWPGFELDELNNRLTYRYNWLIKESAIDTAQLTIITGNLLLSLDMFNDPIKQIADGQLTFNELLRGIAEFGHRTKN
ncbi:hypothetical protein [Candidatus Protochlamydia sp. W-9]|uniref:hypothetical protein n=1 Tax=Candidatus Protochlamydia sp. W-9 TaxID=1785087 RepID=UPI00096A4048|nr:hypothetical protein [Candidatus Protochlamydia sp. W-9]